MLFSANFYSILIARKIFTLISCIEFFCVIFFSKNMHFYLKTAFLGVFFLEKLQKQKSVANPQGNNVNTLWPKKICTCPVLLTFAIAILIEKQLIFIEDAEILRVFFMQKTAEKNDLSEILEAILVKTFGKYYLHLSRIVNFFECNVIQKILDFYLKYSLF